MLEQVNGTEATKEISIMALAPFVFGRLFSQTNMLSRYEIQSKIETVPDVVLERLHVGQVQPSNLTKTFDSTSSTEFAKELNGFLAKLVESSKPLDAELASAINKNFWNLF